MAAKKKAAKTKTKAQKKTAASKPAVKKKTVAAKAAAKKKTTAKKAAAPKKAATPKARAKASATRAKSTAPKAAAKPAASKAAAKPAARSKPARKKATGSRVTPASTSSHAGPVPGIAPYTPGKGEEYMGEAQVEHFRKILLAWKRELMEEVDRTVHHMQDEAANFPDPNDRATQESEFSMELRARDRERKLIKKIDEALMNLDNDEYGYCEGCGVEIGIRRLEARPTATLCIDCKTLDEIREKQRG